MNKLEIGLIEGIVAPRYPTTTKQLTIKKAIVTEEGTESRLPVVDLQLVDEEGNEYFIMTTGRIINMLSGVIKGVNLRIHGTEEP